jgi:hypothetical protein
MAILGYGTVGSNRLTEAKAFYDSLFASVGIVSVFEHPSGGRIYGKGNSLIFRGAWPDYYSYFRDLDGNKLCAYNLG